MNKIIRRQIQRHANEDVQAEMRKIRNELNWVEKK